MRSSQPKRKEYALIATLLVAFLTVLFLILAVQSGTTVASGHQAIIHFQAPEDEIPVETEITVTVRISNVVDLWALAMTIDFPVDKLQVIDGDGSKEGIQAMPAECPDPDTNQGFIVQNQADNTVGTVSYAITQLAPTPPVTGDCNVLQIRFSTLDGPEAVLNFSSVTLSTIDGIEIPVTKVDRQLTLEKGEEEIYLPLILKN